jgi:hypothetical protein
MDGACDGEGCWSGMCIASHQYKGWQVCRMRADPCPGPTEKSIVGLHHLHFWCIALAGCRKIMSLSGHDFSQAANDSEYVRLSP